MGLKQDKQDEGAPRPDVEVGDHLYVHHAGQPCSGVVRAHGEHGVTVKIGGRDARVTWKHVLGHKKRAAKRYRIVDEGEDGMVVEDAGGGRRFVAIPPESKEDPMMVKADGQRPVLLFRKAMAPRPGLAQRDITDKNGVHSRRWMRVDQGAPAPKKGMHVGFANGEHRGHGEVRAVGKKGVTVRDGAGGVHRIDHDKVTHHWEGDGAPDKSPHEDVSSRPDVKPHEGDPDNFNAASFAARYDDPEATAESIVGGFGGDAAERIEKARQRLAGVTQTIDEHSKGGVWNADRAAFHRKLIFDGTEINGKKVPGLLAPDRVKAATPPNGERPTFIALGGRGGSGKSALNGLVYEESRAVVLDADHIKGMLPEYAGWNAHQVHEESSHVLESVLAMAKILGVNVVLDATMKTGKSIESKVDEFKDAGFRTEAHYMHLPRQEAAKRAISRFLGGGERGRFVPPEVVLGNTKNEENFDRIKSKVDAWSFHDNSGEKGSGPKLIARKGDPGTVTKRILTKSDQSGIVVLWRWRR